MSRGGDLGGTEGTVPPKIWGGNGPCIGPPNILRSSVVGHERKHRVKKGVVFSEIVLFVVKKGSYTTFYTVKLRRIWKKGVKIRKTWSTAKKRSSEFLGVKMEIFFRKKVIQKFWSMKNFSVPQTRRQVSATDNVIACICRPVVKESRSRIYDLLLQFCAVGDHPLVNAIIKIVY